MVAVASTEPSWRVAPSIVARLGYDSNVHLQDETPSPACAGAVAPRRGSWFGTIASQLAVRRTGSATLEGTYGAEVVRYASTPGENHAVHRAQASATGRPGATTWTLLGQATWTDGSALGPIFGGVGGAAAMGGIPLRDRRAALVVRTSARMSHTRGAWVFRPLASFYHHDFRTEQSPQPGYVNYIDRAERLAGGDAGFALAPQIRLLAGYRGGAQSQGTLLGKASPYVSTLHRALVGLETTGTGAFQATLLAGPEWRQFAHATPAGFDRGWQRLWVDALAVLRTGARDAFSASWRQFSQPSFGSVSIYQDITFEAVWRRRWTAKVESTLRYKAYGGEWQPPALRHDWVLTPAFGLTAALGRSVVELDVALDNGLSRLPDTGGRNFHRAVATISLKRAL